MTQGQATTPYAASGVSRRDVVQQDRPVLIKQARQGRSPFWWVRTLTPITIICLTFLVVIVGCAIFAPLVAPHDPAINDLRNRLAPPFWAESGSTTNLLGTDQLGRDLLSRMIYGARVSLAVGVLGTLIGAVVGVLCGLVAGFVRGVLDESMMFLVDAVIAVPFLIIALSVIAVFGTSMTVLVGVAAFSGWASYTRVARGLAMGGRERQFVEASRALGASPGRLLMRHILPNIAAPLIVLATFQLTSIILLEASLSFLGFGIQPPTPSWGHMVSEGREYLNTAWWIGMFPGAVLMLITISVSLTGDWLRDVLDPALRSR